MLQTPLVSYRAIIKPPNTFLKAFASISASKKSAQHPTGDVPRHATRVQSAASKIRCVTEFVASREGESVCNGETQGNDYSPILASSHPNPYLPIIQPPPQTISQTQTKKKNTHQQASTQ